MKKRPVNWPLGNPDFVAWEVEAAAGLLVARRNHALVRNGQRLCQGSRPLARPAGDLQPVERFGDDYGTVSRLAEEFRTSRTSDNVATWRANNCLHFG